MPSQFWDEDLAARAARYERFDYHFPQRSLTGKVILAPGGAGGLGAATVALLIAEGAQVVIGYRQNQVRAEDLADALNARGPGHVHCVAGDLRQAEAREQLVKAAAQLTGEIYGFVSFLGDPARVDYAALDERALSDSLAINYIAPVLLAKQVSTCWRTRSPAAWCFSSACRRWPPSRAA